MGRLPALQARPYTPTSLDSDPRVRGFMELVVKIYRPQGGRPGGVMSCHLDDLPMGYVLQVRDKCLYCPRLLQATKEHAFPG